MDAGLLSAFEGLPENLRQSMVGFVEAAEPGSRLKLPTFLRPKQRKAVHLWAEARSLGHRSFGWASRRRLHLSFAGARIDGSVHGAEGQQEEEEEFDWAAWEENDEEANEENDEEANEWGNDETSDQ